MCSDRSVGIIMCSDRSVEREGERERESVTPPIFLPEYPTNSRVLDHLITGVKIKKHNYLSNSFIKMKMHTLNQNPCLQANICRLKQNFDIQT